MTNRQIVRLAVTVAVLEHYLYDIHSDFLRPLVNWYNPHIYFVTVAEYILLPAVIIAVTWLLTRHPNH